MPEGLGGVPPAPWERHDHLVGLGAATRADGEADAARPGEFPGDLRREARRRALPLLGARGASCGATVRADAGLQASEPLLGDREPPGHRERQLHSGAREVQVRAVEHPELRDACRLAHLSLRRVPPCSRRS